MKIPVHPFWVIAALITLKLHMDQYLHKRDNTSVLSLFLAYYTLKKTVVLLEVGGWNDLEACTRFVVSVFMLSFLRFLYEEQIQKWMQKLFLKRKEKKEKKKLKKRKGEEKKEKKKREKRKGREKYRKKVEEDKTKRDQGKSMETEITKKYEHKEKENRYEKENQFKKGHLENIEWKKHCVTFLRNEIKCVLKTAVILWIVFYLIQNDTKEYWGEWLETMTLESSFFSWFRRLDIF